LRKDFFIYIVPGFFQALFFSPMFHHRLILLTLATGMFLGSMAQVTDASPQYIRTSFLKDSILIKENVYGFNSLSLTNLASETQTYTIFFEIPCFVNLVSSQQQEITAEPNETVNVPIRFVGNAKNNCEVTWQDFKIMIANNKLNFQTSRSFYTKPDIAFKWKAILNEPTLILTSNKKAPVFHITISNTGNTDDEYKINFSSPFPLSTGKEIHVALKQNESKTIDVTVKLSEEELNSFETGDVTIILEDNSGEKRMLLQKISKVESIFKGATDPWQRLPVSLELNSINLLQKNPGIYLRALGTTGIGKGKMIGFNFQSPTVFKDGTVLKTGIYAFNYLSKAWIVNLGTFTDFNEFPVFGNGFKIKHYTRKNNSYELGFDKHKNEDVSQAFEKTTFRLGRKTSLFNNNFLNVDGREKQNSVLTTNRFEWTVNSGLFISVTGKIGMTKVKTPFGDTILSGAGAGYALQKPGGFIYGNSYLNYHTKNMPGMNRGYTQYFHDYRTRIGKRFYVGSFVEINNQLSGIYRDSSYHDIFGYKTRNISGIIGMNTAKLNLNFLPGIFYQLQDSLNSFQAKMKKIGMNAYFTLMKNFQVSYSNVIGYVDIPEYKKIGSVFSMSNFLTVQSMKGGIVLRYDRGPFLYFEIKQFLKDSIPLQRFQASPYVNLRIPRYNLDIQSQVVISITKPGAENSYSSNNSINWQNLKTGVTAGANANIDFSGKNTFINLFIRKSLKVPVYKKFKNKNIRIVLFKDKNGDSQKQDDEEVISMANVMLDKSLLQTNMQGELSVLNYYGNLIALDLSTINNVAGWLPSNGFKQNLPATGDKTILIPFKKAKQIVGKLILDKDEKSEIGFDVGSIRITALGRSGAVFTTLSGGDGSYYINVLDDEYTLSINQNVFDENFKVVDPVRTVDLVNNKQIRADFIIRQKRREIKIKKE
jgi:hypothetical protein